MVGIPRLALLLGGLLAAAPWSPAGAQAPTPIQPRLGAPVAAATPVAARAPVSGRQVLRFESGTGGVINLPTAAANVFLGRELTRRIGPFRINDYAAMNRRAAELFGELKSETRPRDLVKQMSGGQRQAVAIARTRLSDAKIVLMDEPTAAISVRQIAEVLNLIRRLRDHGIAVALISHRMPDVFDVADRVIVMRRGRKVADKRIADSSPEEVTGLITGAIETA